MSEIDLTAAVTRLEAAMGALRARLRDHLGVSGSDLTVLQFVARAEAAERKVRVKDLASHLGLSGPAVTGIVDRLERSGHLCRVPNPDDGRSRFIELTPRPSAPTPRRWTARTSICTICCPPSLIGNGRSTSGSSTAWSRRSSPAPHPLDGRVRAGRAHLGRLSAKRS
ncbi:MarR family transcriptional regulator [Curtobacterium flaccumfaciens]|nr:MarR family transcriptional regulator [Curtobacterium flaccumfaciens]